MLILPIKNILSDMEINFKTIFNLDSKKIKFFCIEISREFYGNDTEKEIIKLLKKIFN